MRNLQSNELEQVYGGGKGRGGSGSNGGRKGGSGSNGGGKGGSS